MKVFMGFIVLCFIVATFTRSQRLQTAQWAVFGVSLLVCFAYFFMNQI